MSAEPEPQLARRPNAPPFSFEEIAAAVQVCYDEPQAAEQLALWSTAFAAAEEDPTAGSAWSFPWI